MGAPSGSGGAAAERPGGPRGCLAIVAGKGELPRRIAEMRRDAGLPYLLVIFPGSEEPWMDAHPLQRHEFEKVGALFRGLASAGAEAVVFAGAMTRPRLRLWRIDLPGLGVLLRALRLLGRGDDAMLRGFGAIFEERGIRLIGAGEILGEAGRLPVGALGRIAPGDRELADAAQAARIVAALGPLDVGQGAVVANGLCLGIEAIGGTDILLAQVAALPPDRRRTAPPPAGTLYKGPKPGQDTRFDQPAIGPETVRGAAKAGLKAIVCAADETVLMAPSETRAEADRLGLAVYGAAPGELYGR